MTKADVDRVIRKYLDPKRVDIAIVSDSSKALRDELLAGKPTPMTYDTKDTPQEVLDEDKIIERTRLPFNASRVKILSARAMFEK
jgi:zinc protease